MNKLRHLTRRHFFETTALSLGSTALASLTQVNAAGAPAAKAKSIIYLFMAGAPSQLDMFDYKPTLTKFDGQPVPEDVIKGERFAFIKGVPKLLASPHSFRQFGQSGAELSNLLPHLSTIVDEVAFIKSMNTTQFN